MIPSMTESKQRELGPIAYPTVRAAYGVFGFGYGAVLGGLAGAGISLLATVIAGGIESAMHGSFEAGFQGISTAYLEIGIPAAGFFGLIGGAISTQMALAEFHRDFTKRSTPTRRKS